MADREAFGGEVSSNDMHASAILNYSMDLYGQLSSLKESAHLDVEEEKQLLSLGMARGLLSADAQRCLWLACEKKGIKVESLLRESFRRRVGAVIGDKLLDESEHEELRKQSEVLFAGIKDWDKLAEGILQDKVKAENAFRVEDIKSNFRRNIRRGDLIALKTWVSLREEEIQRLRDQGVIWDENDLGEILEQVLKEQEAEVQATSNIHIMLFWMALVALVVYIIGRIVLHV